MATNEVGASITLTDVTKPQVEHCVIYVNGGNDVIQDRTDKGEGFYREGVRGWMTGLPHVLVAETARTLKEHNENAEPKFRDDLEAVLSAIENKDGACRFCNSKIRATHLAVLRAEIE